MSRSAVNGLTSTYQPRAGDTCMRVVNAVSKALDSTTLDETGGKGAQMLSITMQLGLIF